jgi:hypothetical protein
LAEDGAWLVVGVDLHRAAFRRPFLGRGKRAGVALAVNHQVGAVRSNERDLRRRRYRRHVDPCTHAELSGRIGDRDAVVAARGGDDSGRGHLAREQIRKRAARFERARMLQQLEFEVQVRKRKIEIARPHVERGRAPHVRPNQPFGPRDRLPAPGPSRYYIAT